VVIAVDVSRSMAAGDAVPDRLGAAVAAADSLVSSLGKTGGERVAVVAFAGRGVLRCPLTANLGAAAESLKALRPGSVQPGGTDLGAALDATLDAFDDQERTGGRVVIVLSDGENHDDGWRSACERLRARGVIVHAVAVGDAARGYPIPTRSGAAVELLRYRGSVVLSKRSDTTLQAVARETGGAFVPLGLATTDLGRLYRTRIEPGSRARRVASGLPDPAERFRLFLAAGLALGLLACVPGRPLTVFARVVLSASLAVIVAGAAPVDDAISLIAEGRKDYRAGHYREALGTFRSARRHAPGNAVPPYDAAAALFQLGTFHEARALYLDARSLADARLQVKIDYALGNTALAQGDLTAAIRHYDECLGTTTPGPDLDAVRRDAARNRRFAEEHVKRSPVPPGGEKSQEPTPPRDSEPPPGEQRNSPLKGGPMQSAGVGGRKGSEDTPPSGGRGSGMAGGEGPAPPGDGSPEDRLSRAVENVRESRRLRLPDVPVPDSRDDRKDW